MTDTNEKILAEAKERFRQCQQWESIARSHWRMDYAFGHGDCYNNAMWEGDAYDARTTSGKPVFTVNRTRNYCNMIVNDARQNKAQIEVRPVGNGASFEAAEIMEGIVRHIEYISNAEQAYEKATYDQVFGGIGWWRVVTDWAGDDSFDQEIFIRRVPDALSVYMDPHIQQYDGSDANWGMVMTSMDRKEFEASYPKYKDAIADLPFDMEDRGDDLWLQEDRVRVCEYYRKTMDTDTLHYLNTGDTVRESEIDDPKALQGLTMRQREITKPKIEHFLIVGDRVVERREWPGRYIPLVRVIGVETVIDGVLDRMGHVRNLIDPQRSYNWYTSSGVEFVAAQSKSPWVAAVQSISGVEEFWRDANLKNYSVLPFNHRDDDGNELEAPHRADPPVYAAAFLDGMKVAASEMELTSGQPPATLGEPSNERSGKAVLERQRAAANSTYHFVNNLSNSLRFTGKILIDLIPKIYDTERVTKILAQDGTLQTVQVNPQAPQAYQQVKAIDGESFSSDQIAAVFNPAVGEYDVVAEVGPQYTTRRQEFVNAMMDILAQNESLTPLVGDLVFRNMDFPGAAEIADRMRRALAASNPAALDNADPQVTALQQQLAQQHAAMMQMGQELQQAKQKAESISYQKEIDFYRAESERMKVVGGIDPQALKPIIREMVSELLNQPVNQVIGMHMHEDALMTAKVAQATNMVHQEGPQPMPPPPANGAGQ